MQDKASLFLKSYLHEGVRPSSVYIFLRSGRAQSDNNCCLIMNHTRQAPEDCSSGSSEVDELFFPASSLPLPDNSSNSPTLGFHQLMPVTLHGSSCDFARNVMETSRLGQEDAVYCMQQQRQQQRGIEDSSQDKQNNLIAETAQYSLIDPWPRITLHNSHETSEHRFSSSSYRHHSTGDKLAMLN